MAWYYTFEAKEIQRFIMQSDKLRDMVGGSELVNRLCGDFLENSLKAVGVTEPKSSIIANAAGWARIRFENEQQAREFHGAWPLLTSRFAPGIQIIQSLHEMTGTLPEAMDKGFEALRGARNLNRFEFPEIGPLVERSPRTGGAAVKVDKERGDKALIDRATVRKRACAEGHSSLVKKISEEFRDAWPYEIDDIVSGKSPYIAVIHADGNDLGATLMRIKEFLKASPGDAARIYRGFSAAIEETTVAAVRAACEATVFAEYRAVSGRNPKARIAARPIVLGGDDLTIIIRADLAVTFTETFLEAFEKGSRDILDKHLNKFAITGRPEHLTACAGIAFVKKAYPFSAAYHMAETLCGHTKRVAKEARKQAGGTYVPSSFTFHRISTSMAEDFDTVKRQELTGRGLVEGKPVRFWLGPYAVGSHGGMLPQLQSLRSLADALARLPQGTVRNLISTMHTNPENADKEYRRILQVAEKDRGDALKRALRGLTGEEGHPLWDAGFRTPLTDAHTLREIAKGGSDVNSQAEI